MASAAVRMGGPDVVSFRESVEILADPERVWRALTVPAEVVCWDTGVLAALDAPATYPAPGQHVHWRYRLGPVRLTLHDRPSEVVPLSRLRSSIQLGPFDFDELYTLSERGSSRTRLQAELLLASRTRFVGTPLERLAGLPIARSIVRTSLAAIRSHCEEPDV